MLLNFILQSGTSSLLSNLPLLAIPVIFYFFILRPQSKARKEQAKFIGELQKGKEVVTTSGIIGRINKMEDDILTIQVDTKTFIRVLRSSVSREMTAALSAKEEEKE